MKRENTAHAAVLIVSMYCSLQSMELSTKDGTVTVPASVIKASPVLATIQEKNDVQAQENILKGYRTCDVQRVFDEQEFMTTKSKNSTREPEQWIGDLSPRMHIAESLKFTALLSQYSALRQGSKQ